MADRTPGALTNVLGEEQSPYLLQHAGNPVAWQPWSQEAFDRARDLDRPVFLSIGYATCHWCHVMEHESFEDDTVASFLNDHFVAIKVDREERPDVDAIYMDVCQAMTGHGGWPLTVFLDADRRPFLAGTYYPRWSRGGRPGFLDILLRISEAWRTERPSITAAAVRVTDMLRTEAQADLHAVIRPDLMERLLDDHRRRYDHVHAGFGTRPKFPAPHHLLALFRCGEEGAGMALRTIDAMRAGGMYDHVGGGFHRYSTDRAWHLPHFEKMLYDQAMMIMAATEAWQWTSDAFYASMVDDVVVYLDTCLTAPEGAFFCAQDADSDGEEGRYYQWESGTLRTVLGDGYDVVAGWFDVHDDGNIHDEATGDPVPANILRAQPSTIRTIVASERWRTYRTLLARHRAGRNAPITDDKRIVDWNGCMIAALARAGRGLHRTDYVDRAERAYAAVTAGACPSGTWHHGYRTSPLRAAAVLDDHAAMAWAAAELYQSTGKDRYREAAAGHVAILDATYVDADGSVRTTAVGVDDILVRQRALADGAAPSGWSMAIMAMSILAAVDEDEAARERTLALLQRHGRPVDDHPQAHCMTAVVWDDLTGPRRSVTFVGDPAHPFLVQARRVVAAAWLPRTVFRYEAGDTTAPPTVRWCTDMVCRRPLTTMDDVERTLRDEVGR